MAEANGRLELWRTIAVGCAGLVVGLLGTVWSMSQRVPDKDQLDRYVAESRRDAKEMRAEIQTLRENMVRATAAMENLARELEQVRADMKRNRP